MLYIIKVSLRKQNLKNIYLETPLDWTNNLFGLKIKIEKNLQDNTKLYILSSSYYSIPTYTLILYLVMMSNNNCG